MWIFPATILVERTDGAAAGPKGEFLQSCKENSCEAVRRSTLLFIGKENMSESERRHEYASEFPQNRVLSILEKKLF